MLKRLYDWTLALAARETLRAAARRTGRWIVWIGLLVLAMELITALFIGW